MPPWLQQAVGEQQNLTHEVLFTRLGAALLLGCLAAGIHVATCRGNDRAAAQSLRATLVLLSVLIALVTMAIGDNVARAFSLVGTLAIVRFRTVVEDTRDTAFVIYAVVAGMCAGGGYLLGPLASAPIVFLAAWVFRGGQSAAAKAGFDASVIVRLAATAPSQEHVEAELRRATGDVKLTELATARGGASYDATYSVKLPSAEQMLILVKTLGSLPGVQGVEIKGK